MEERPEILQELLKTPGTAEKLKELADGLLSGSEKPEPSGPKEPAGDPLPSLTDGLDPGEIGKILSLVRAFKSNESDDRTRLLLALRPHLSRERQQRVDEAVKILRLISLLPLVREAGIF